MKFRLFQVFDYGSAKLLDCWESTDPSFRKFSPESVAFHNPYIQKFGNETNMIIIIHKSTFYGSNVQRPNTPRQIFEESSDQSEPIPILTWFILRYIFQATFRNSASTSIHDAIKNWTWLCVREIDAQLMPICEKIGTILYTFFDKTVKMYILKPIVH